MSKVRYEDIEPISGKEENINLSSLHIRWIPQAKLERFWNGKDLMSLSTSPHVEILQMHIGGAGPKDLMQTRYAAERRFRRELGMKRWTEEYILEHIIHRIKTYKSLKAHGYISGDKPVEILNEPFWNTRYNLNDDRIHGNEIWNGAGRCAAAFVLGWKNIPGVWVRDRYPGMMKCDKIDRKYSV